MTPRVTRQRIAEVYQIILGGLSEIRHSPRPYHRDMLNALRVADNYRCREPAINGDADAIEPTPQIRSAGWHTDFRFHPRVLFTVLEQ